MKNTLVIGIGNQIMGDDSIALHVVRALRELPSLRDQPIDFIEREDSGLSLLDIISDYDTVIIIDSIKTGKHPIGSVRRVQLEKLEKISAWGNHYMGLGETIGLLKKLKMDVPGTIIVLGIEISDPYRIGLDLSEHLKLEFFSILIYVKRFLAGLMKDRLHLV